jgi:hypothetical protein
MLRYYFSRLVEFLLPTLILEKIPETWTDHADLVPVLNSRAIYTDFLHTAEFCPTCRVSTPNVPGNGRVRCCYCLQVKGVRT